MAPRAHRFCFGALAPAGLSGWFPTRRPRALGLAGALLWLGGAAATQAQPSAGPAGIFVIGDTRPVAGEVAKFDFDFVSGYTLRVPWTELEDWDAATQAPRYNFSRIETTLEELRARGKRMTIEIFVNQAPAHVLSLPGMVTWTNPHPTQGGVQAVPWNPQALAAYQRLIESLANHQVAGTAWRVADHPSLESVDAPIVGLQGWRELSDTLVHHPDYGRDRFIQAVVDSVAISRRAFANKFGFLALFSMSDSVAAPALDDVLHERLMTEFNVPGKPTLGFFQETLSDAGPRPDGLGRLLHKAAPSTYIMFQALRPWALRDGEVRPVEIASGTPVTGIEFAWANYGATYVELYGADILAPENSAALRTWNQLLRGDGGGGGDVAPVITTHPTSRSVTAGTTVTFTAAASGSPAPAYQWQKGGVNLSGATSDSYTLANVGSGDAGSYTVVATNSAGSVTSNAATLTVASPPAPAASPSSGGGGGGAPTLWFATAVLSLGICRRFFSRAC